MKRNWKRILSMLLCTAMVFTMNMQVFAEDMSVSEDSVKSAKEVDVSSNAVSDDGHVYDEISENTISDDSISDDSISVNSVSEDTAADVSEAAGDMVSNSGIHGTAVARDVNLNMNGYIAGIEDPVNTGSSLWSGSKIYYAGQEYYVLDKDGEITDGHSSQSGNMLLLKAGNLDYAAFDDDGSGDWSSSTLRSNLNDGGFLSTLSAVEQSSLYATPISSDNTSNGGYKGYPSSTTYDKIFLLDITDIQNSSYGFKTKGTRGADDLSWLRSTGDAKDIASVVYTDGSLDVSNINAFRDAVKVRPAFNLNLSSVLFASDTGKTNFGTVSGESVSNNDWKLTLKDGNTGCVAVRYDDGDLSAGTEVSLNIISLGTAGKDVKYDRVSALLTDSANTVLCYGKIGTGTGKYTIKIPEGITGGSKLYVFPENVSQTASITDYAGNMVDISEKTLMTVDSVTVTPSAASVQTGSTKQFTASVNGTNEPVQNVTWSVAGENSADTNISADGILSVGGDETAKTLTVMAVSDYDTSKSDSATVTVSSPEPAPEPVLPSDARHYTVSFNSDGTTVSSMAVTAGEKITLPAAPSKSGAVFGGWFTKVNGQGTQYTDGTAITGNTILYAYWLTSEQRTDISVCTITDVQPQIYDGDEKRPSLTVKEGKARLTEGVDYEVSYSANVNAGDATATVHGMGNYRGTKSIIFRISKKKLTNSGFEVYVNDMRLTVSEAESPVTVYDRARNEYLTAYKDYTASYENDDKAGTAKVTVSAAAGSNYYWRLSRTYKIFAADSKMIAAVSIDNVSAYYTGRAYMPKVTSVTDPEGKAVDAKYYSVKYKNNKNAGLASVIVTGRRGYKGSVTVSFAINPVSVADLSNLAIKQISAKTFSGSPVKPKPTVQYTNSNGKKVTLSAKYYTVVYSDNLQAGTAHILVTGRGNYSGTVSGIFEIAPRAIKNGAKLKGFRSSVKLEGSAATQNMTLYCGKYKLREGTDYTLTYTGNTAVGNAKVTIMAAAGSSFTGSTTKNFKVK